jgi:hypothetical protein
MKKIGLVTMVLLGIFALQKIVAAEIGDANNDGVVNVADVVTAVNAANGQQADNFNLSAADMNGDGVITLEDAKLIARKILRPEMDLSNALYDDYERAFVQGYLAKGYYYYDRKQQITSQEFKAMLKPLVEKYSPDKMEYFNSRISDVDIPITRSIAVGMAYYAAHSIEAFFPNFPYPFDRTTYDDFWDNFWDNDAAMTEVLPYGRFQQNDTDLEDIVTAALQNGGHVSLISGKEIVEYYVGEGWHWNNPFTWEEAVRAITRLYDSFKPETEYANIDDPRVTNPDATIITPELIAKAAKKEIHDIADMPRIIGVQLGGGGNQVDELSQQFGTTARDVKEIAEWGFNSMLSTASWRHLFTYDMQAKLNVFRDLDIIIAAAMENGIHLNLRMCAMPGCGAYNIDDIRDDYDIDSDILNEEKRKKACDIWRTIATRYKDVPNANLSFEPISELGALYEDNWGGQTFSIEQINDYYDIMIDAIREVSPERFIFYDAIYNPSATQSSDGAAIGLAQYNHMSMKYKNTRQARVWMDMAYMFNEYNQGDGNIDWAHHSVWVPTYPITLYSANGLLLAGGNDKLTIDGCLPEGATVNFYLSAASGGTSLQIDADGMSLYEETIEGDQVYNVGFSMAFGEQFKSSDKKISVKLTEKVSEIIFSISTGGLNWCGVEVVLPESYTVEKWRKDSEWDVELGLIAPEEAHIGEFYMKPTSTVQIGSTYNDWQDSEIGFHITINDDVSFKTDYIYSESNKEFTELLVKENCESAPNWSARFEDILVTDMAGALNYWDDTMDVFQKYNVDVWVSALGLMYEESLAPMRIAGYEGEDFEGHHNFNVKLLRILQKYMDK